MAKKKRQNQSSNNAVESSESESSKDSSQVAEGNKTSCSHINKSVDITCVKKTIKSSRDKNLPLFCLLCRKNNSNASKDVWVCLRCGSCNCGPEEEDHRIEHYNTPHSDSHYLAFQINSNLIWCFGCKQDIPIEINKKVQGCTDLIKKQYNEHLQFSPVEIESDTKNMNGNCSENYSKRDISTCQPLQNVCLNKDVSKPNLMLPKVRGLNNLGNTCFFNSVLQCLAQTPGLVELLREMDVPGEKFHIELDGVTIDAVLEKHKTSALSEQLAQILTEVSGVKTVGDGKTGLYAVNPKRLKDALTQKCPQFEGGDQHDSHELLRHLLDSVHTEDLRRYQKAILDHIGYSKTLDKVDEDKKKFGKKLNQKVCETIPIRPDQIFKGSLVSILQCTICGHISKRDEPFLDLSLPVVQEKAQPPILRRKQNCNSPVEEKQNTEVTVSKHQQKKQKKNWTRHNRKNKRAGNKAEQTQGEPTIEEEDKKDSIDGEQSDADVEDNEDNACEEQDHKTEIVESGYSSEKQMSARGSPVTTQSPEEESKCDFKPVFQGCENNPDYLQPLNDISMYSSVNSISQEPGSLHGKTTESGLGSIQELTVTIPEETNMECTSQDSVRVNASRCSPEISSDSQHGHFKTIDLSPCDYKLLPSNESQVDRTAMIYGWNCTGDIKSQSQESSSVSLSVSPQHGSQSSQDNINNVSPKCSPKGSPVSGSHSNDNMSVCTSLPYSNDNMSVCNSLPENVSMIFNSPIKSQNSHIEENSESEERPESRMECRKNRSSPVELGEDTELDSGLLKLSLEGITCAGDVEDSFPHSLEEVTNSAIVELPFKAEEPVCNSENKDGLALVGGEVTTSQIKEAIPLPPPPPLPLFSSSYSYSHPEPSLQRYSSTFSKYIIEEGEFSLQSCLNQFTTIEMLAGGNKVGCEACTEKINKGNKEGKTVYQNSTKQLLISKLPPIVIFHLKRFQVQKCSFRKISRHVDFPLVLDIAPFCSLSENNGSSSGSILYSLYGVVEHSGTLHGGHYVAYVKVRSHMERRPGSPPPGKWYYISDSRVSDIEESFVLKTQAYLLFYERI